MVTVVMEPAATSTADCCGTRRKPPVREVLRPLSFWNHGISAQNGTVRWTWGVLAPGAASAEITGFVGLDSLVPDRAGHLDPWIRGFVGRRGTNPLAGTARSRGVSGPMVTKARLPGDQRCYVTMTEAGGAWRSYSRGRDADWIPPSRRFGRSSWSHGRRKTEERSGSIGRAGSP